MSQTSFIERFVEYCEGTPTPPLFAKWAAIAAISGATERRVWATTRNTQLIPNTIILLVAPPGVGKSRVISEVHELWLASKMFNVCPTTVTKAALIDQLAEKVIIRTVKDQKTGKAKIIEYRSCLIATPEFGVLITKHDLEFLNTINDLFDCRTNFVERRRSLDETITLPNPHISMIAGTQPNYLGSLLPDEAYGMGFTARCIMIHQSQGPAVPIFENKVQQRKLFGELLFTVKQIGDLYGEVTWHEDVQKELQDWVDEGLFPVPPHAKLQHYNTRRDLHLLKLCIIRAASELRTVVFLRDYHWAKATLLEAEVHMNDVFRDMLSGPDSQVIQDTIYFIEDEYGKKNRPVSQSRVYDFLSARVSSNKIREIYDIVGKSGKITEQVNALGLRTFIPRKPEEE